MMTLKKFLSLLSKRAKKYGFKFTSSGVLRENRTRCCPITAVCQMVKNKKYHVNRYDNAAKAINLPEDYAERIVACADTDNNEEDSVRFLDRKDRDLRREMLKSINLYEPKKKA